MVNDFLPILWGFGGSISSYHDVVKMSNHDQTLQALKLLHVLGNRGPTYEQYLSTMSLRKYLQDPDNETEQVAAIEWSSATRMLNLPAHSKIQWSDLPCAAYRIHGSKVAGGVELSACHEAGVLATWAIAAPQTADARKRKQAINYVQSLKRRSSQGILCTLAGLFPSPPVLTDCDCKSHDVNKDFYQPGGALDTHGLPWQDGCRDRSLEGRFRPVSSDWHEFEQQLGTALSDVILDLRRPEDLVDEDLAGHITELERPPNKLLQHPD
jgi:hypothetical protein